MNVIKLFCQENIAEGLNPCCAQLIAEQNPFLADPPSCVGRRLEGAIFGHTLIALLGTQLSRIHFHVVGAILPTVK